jgi:hypothetical protein
MTTNNIPIIRGNERELMYSNFVAIDGRHKEPVIELLIMHISPALLLTV